MIRKCMDVKLNVKPVFVMFAHKYYYEGPCRMTGGDSLQPGFDSIVNGAIFQGTMEGIKHVMPECVHIMEPVFLETSCDWEVKGQCSSYRQRLTVSPDIQSAVFPFCIHPGTHLAFRYQILIFSVSIRILRQVCAAFHQKCILADLFL